jgi:hypothetical protein
MSALPPLADMCGATRDVRFGPIADITGFTRSPRRRAQAPPHRSVQRRIECGRRRVRFAGRRCLMLSRFLFSKSRVYRDRDLGTCGGAVQFDYPRPLGKRTNAAQVLAVTVPQAGRQRSVPIVPRIIGCDFSASANRKAASVKPHDTKAPIAANTIQRIGGATARVKGAPGTSEFHQVRAWHPQSFLRARPDQHPLCETQFRPRP